MTVLVSRDLRALCALAVSLSDVSHIIFGPYTDTFAKKTVHDRIDPRWACFSLVLRESRTVDFAAEDETSLLPWLLGLQQLIVYFSPSPVGVAERWTLPKLHLQKLRLKVSGESDRTGQGPYDVVLSAVLDVSQEGTITSEKATVLQAAWRRRNVQGTYSRHGTAQHSTAAPPTAALTYTPIVFSLSL